VSWNLVFSKQARKDSINLASAGLKAKAEDLLDILRQDPLRSPPPYEKLIGGLAGYYSRRINIQHRLVYEILVDQHTVKVVRMWSHYGGI
jgi:toxin YoeB